MFAQIFARGVGGSMDFWDFSEKKSFLLRHQLTSHFFLLFSMIEKFHLAVRRNCAKCGADPKKTSRFPNIH